jgi:hypothetical protein
MVSSASWFQACLQLLAFSVSFIIVYRRLYPDQPLLKQGIAALPSNQLTKAPKCDLYLGQYPAKSVECFLIFL